MGRPRGFDTEALLTMAAGLFARRGYDGTSVDDLVRELGVHRGSLYAVFGSKRGLFLATLDHIATLHHLSGHRPRDGREPAHPRVNVAQDVVLVGLLELAPHDPLIRERAARLVPALFGTNPRAIGVRILTRAGCGPQPKESP